MNLELFNSVSYVIKTTRGLISPKEAKERSAIVSQETRGPRLFGPRAIFGHEKGPTYRLIGMSLSGAFSQGAIDFLTRMAKIKFPTQISSGSLSFLPARQRWTKWSMRIIQRNVLETF